MLVQNLRPDMTKTYDFRTLDTERFEELVNQLLSRLFPEIKPVHGAGGDEGIDCFKGILSEKISVYQHKFFCDSITGSRRRQIKNSLITAVKNHKVEVWTLVIPKELTVAEHTWFEELIKKYPKVKIDLMNQVKLTDALLKNQDIARTFFPIAELLERSKRQEKMWAKAVESLKHAGYLRDKYELKPRVKQMGICMLQIIGTDPEEIVKRVYTLYPNEQDAEFGITKPVKDKNSFLSRLVFRRGKISFEVENEKDDPFHLVYPHINSVDIIISALDAKLTGSTITIFSANFALRDFLRKILIDALGNHVTIDKITLDSKMKELVKKYASPIDALRFDPAITEQIKEAGGREIQANINRETLLGVPGLPKMEWVQKALSNIPRLKKGQVSDILFFRARHAANFDKEHLITFEVHHDGRVRAFFPAHKFPSAQSMKEPLLQFARTWLS